MARLRVLGVLCGGYFRVLRADAPRCSTPDEATRLLQEYVRIDTSNPPGDTRKAADFLASIFEREGIPVTRYESAPGKAIISRG